MKVIQDEFDQMVDLLRECIKEGKCFTFNSTSYDVQLRVERIRCIESVLEAHQQEPFTPYLLQTFADLILYEELTDANPYKVQSEDYPIMSSWQFHLRQQREYNIILAEEMDVNYMKCNPPVRRKRTAKEEWIREKNDQERLRKTNVVYNHFSNPGPIKMYKYKMN
ncbi:hypothetical protein [Chengkuizengella axinellae]|uniref:Uncharacterized protein n=1 Tax=Chengkuizengella axinellae TaxID=3064388 RepID=A0ABT9J249_9BACL|nr:hypothetical protein [Chengkuizengella sp. 2205SS18-9]MDP5275691.1 hypothetical protein [Chengkuizengella sp. 2205SS18-9]